MSGGCYFWLVVFHRIWPICPCLFLLLIHWEIGPAGTERTPVLHHGLCWRRNLDGALHHPLILKLFLKNTMQNLQHVEMGRTTSQHVVFFYVNHANGQKKGNMCLIFIGKCGYNGIHIAEYAGFMGFWGWETSLAPSLPEAAGNTVLGSWV